MKEGALRAGELASLTGVSTDTLRHYEREGLLSSRRAPNGYRQYPPEAQGRVQLVRHALTVGFTLDELARFLTVREQGGAPCRQVRELAAKKLKELEARIRGLQELREALRVMLGEWDARLAGAKNGERAWLLETLVKASASAGGGGPHLPARLRKGGNT
jgi:DNA-binding transcriptional MerR regulator